MNWSATLFILLIWFAVAVNACEAHAQDRPVSADEWTTSAQLWAARACFAEASFNQDDCRELLWVITRRADPGQWLSMLRDYCAGMGSKLRKPSPRQSSIRDFPWGDVPGRSVRFNARWKALRAFVSAWSEGKHASRCPAIHWGGRADRPQGGMVAVECMGTANTFYRVARR